MGKPYNFALLFFLKKYMYLALAENDIKRSGSSHLYCEDNGLYEGNMRWARPLEKLLIVAQMEGFCMMTNVFFSHTVEKWVYPADAPPRTFSWCFVAYVEECYSTLSQKI